MAQATNRAIGIVRVSVVGGREGETFHSPEVQRERIRGVCKAQGLKLVDTFEELDVSGRKPLDQRKGLSAAVAAVEAGRVDVVAAAYFDRLFRSLPTQAEVIERVERAGGKVLAVDVGQVTNGSAAQWLSGTMLGAVSEYYSRSVGERLHSTQVRCIARGAAPFPVPPGYHKREDGVAEPDGNREYVLQAFRMRAESVSLPIIRRYLADNGVRLSLGGLTRLLSNRFYLGELHYGDHEPNLTAHEPIIPLDVFSRVQSGKGAPKGRLGKSNRLLARLGILRCGTCGGRMSVSSKTNNRATPAHFYRCTAPDCTRRMTVSATMVEDAVVSEVKRLLKGVRGSAKAGDGVTQATADLERAQAQLDAALTVFADLVAEPAAIERLNGLRAARDASRERRDEALDNSAAKSVAVTVGDWEELTLAERRSLIKAVIERVTVTPGPDRIAITPRA